ncbi:hypothetical protein F4818DRAFT_445686 [Hypoxylon cercidicola]|nr:hypothetical protein F4818DRAFT_445686 [Hypoxylon cercidicola]
MADQSEIIKINPIGSGLDTFVSSFCSFCKSKDICCSEEALDQLGDENVQNLISRLLQTLQNLPIARLLPSPTRGTLRSDLLRLEVSLDSDDFDFGRVKPLLRVVVTKKPDKEIWAQTSSSSNMGSLVNSSERRNDTGPIVKEDLGPMYVDVPQFYEAFFGGIAQLESAS